MRLVPLIVVLAPIVVIACEDEQYPTDCVDAGGLCFDYYFGPIGEEYEQTHVACERELFEKAQCSSRQPKNPNGPYRGCCIPRTCAEGRGTCHDRCPAAKVLNEDDPECAFRDPTVKSPCCAP